MKKVYSTFTTGLTVSLFVFMVHAQPPQPASKEVTFKAKDGVTLYGDVFLSKKGKEAPLIMLFHQAGGDARGEYGPIVPRLLEQGWNVLEVDQRSGGSRFGNVNRTVAALEGKQYSYCDAYQDLEAALQYAKYAGFAGKRFAWGSSYSAALVIQLGAKHPKDLAGVLAFSPATGGPMADCKPEQFVPNLKIPVLALRPASEAKLKSVQHQIGLFHDHGIRTYVADPGVHGSSMLVPERVGSETGKTWNVVLQFIRSVLDNSNSK